MNDFDFVKDLYNALNQSLYPEIFNRPEFAKGGKLVLTRNLERRQVLVSFFNFPKSIKPQIEISVDCRAPLFHFSLKGNPYELEKLLTPETPESIFNPLMQTLRNNLDIKIDPNQDSSYKSTYLYLRGISKDYQVVKRAALILSEPILDRMFC